MPRRNPLPRAGLPLRPFLYTLDQIANLLTVPLTTIKKQYIFYIGRNVGTPPAAKMSARNIAIKGNPPDWRVDEKEFIRWLRFQKFTVYETASIERLYYPE